MMPNISIIMSTYKEDIKVLQESIDSILNQTYTDFEFIIVLDNPDNMEHIGLIEDYQKQDQRIRFFINDKNMGLTASLNRGLSLAKGKYICRMDADDVSMPYRIEKQLEYLVQNKYDLIGGITQMIDENGKVIYSIKNVPTDFNQIKKALKYGQCIAHPTWIGKKEVFDNLEGYRNMPLCEDYDFTLRAVKKGYKISNLNETVLKYRMTANSISRQNLFEQYLYMQYITKQYAKNEDSSIEEAHIYVQCRNNDKIAQRYMKANVIFNRMLKELEDKKMIGFVKDGICLVFTSKYYLNKIYRFARLSMYS